MIRKILGPPGTGKTTYLKNKVEELLKSPLIIDLRNMFSPDDIIKKGFEYVSIGRKTVYGSSN